MSRIVHQAIFAAVIIVIAVAVANGLSVVVDDTLGQAATTVTDALGR